LILAASGPWSFRRPPSLAPAIDALGQAVSRVTAAAALAQVVADYVPDLAGKLDCRDAIERNRHE
jgi:hypothetical protein